jgi:hypothetical protein
VKAWRTQRMNSQYHALEVRMLPVKIAMCGAWLEDESRLEFRPTMLHVCSRCRDRYQKQERAA